MSASLKPCYEPLRFEQVIKEEDDFIDRGRLPVGKDQPDAASASADGKARRCLQAMVRMWRRVKQPMPRFWGRSDVGVSAEDEPAALASDVVATLDQRERSALCLSGGGIRSATFGLGILQGLAHKGVLAKFDYLSTVSGGGYIGSWLSAWMHHGGVDEVVKALRGEASTAGQAGESPEPEPIRHLRAYNNYLSPRLGLASPDTWALVATYIRNLFLNWLILIPMLAVLVAIPCIWVEFTKVCHGGGYLAVPLIFAASMLMVAVFAIQRSRLASTRSPKPPHAGQALAAQRCYVVACLTPLVLGSFALAVAPEWMVLVSSDRVGSWLILAGVAAGVGGLGWVAHACCMWLGKRPARGDDRLSGSATETEQPPGRCEDSATAPRVFRAKELAALLFCSVLAGTLVWLIAINLAELLKNASGSGIMWIASLTGPLILCAYGLSESVFIGLMSFEAGNEDREWWARSQGFILRAVVCWVIVSMLVLFGADAVRWLFRLGKTSGTLASIAGAASAIGSLWGAFSSKTPAVQHQPSGGWGKGLLNFAGTIFIAMLVILLAAGSRSLVSRSWWPGTTMVAGGAGQPTVTIQLVAWLIFAGIMMLIATMSSWFVNINRFSLHAVYRNRLIRAYLRASRPAKERRIDLFTGFDRTDNFYLRELQDPPGANKESSSPRRLFHLLGMTLNLAGDARQHQLAWQERKAAPFTMSPLHCGSHALNAYRPSKRYAGPKGVRLGTAMAISGAAANPNMGYNSSSLLTFLMTLFNIRLGWWCGNPRKLAFDKRGPRPAGLLLLSELLGRTDDDHKYVNLSDGGHFDNLGLYEVVLRRCHRVLVIDAGCDGECKFSDLGNAIRKIRIDLGVDIVFENGIRITGRSKDCGPKSSRDRDWSPTYCAVGRIHYPPVNGKEVKHGTLIYVKPALCGKEPRDVLAYAEMSEEFPHESTADQFFGESQFESYRQLGRHIVKTISNKKDDEMDAVEDMDVPSFFDRGQERCSCVAGPATKAGDGPQTPARPVRRHPQKEGPTS